MSVFCYIWNRLFKVFALRCLIYIYIFLAACGLHASQTNVFSKFKVKFKYYCMLLYLFLNSALKKCRWFWWNTNRQAGIFSFQASRIIFCSPSFLALFGARSFIALLDWSISFQLNFVVVASSPYWRTSSVFLCSWSSKIKCRTIWPS